jgi:cell division protein FtsX
MAFDLPVLLLLFRRGVRRGVVTLRREGGWLPALGALFCVMLTAQLLLFLGVVAEGAGGMVRAQSDLHVEFRENTSEKDVQSLFTAAHALPDVESVAYVTREQSYARERVSNPQFIAFLEQDHLRNPFPDMLVVTLRSQDATGPFEAFLRQPAWAGIVDPSSFAGIENRQKGAQELGQLLTVSEVAIGVLLSLLAFVLLFVTMEFVRRRAGAFQAEILVENLSGASATAVVLPFATESFVLLLLATVFSGLFLAGASFVLPPVPPALLEGAGAAFYGPALALLSFVWPLLLLVECGIALVIAWLGAWLGLRSLLGVSEGV